MIIISDVYAAQDERLTDTQRLVQEANAELDEIERITETNLDKAEELFKAEKGVAIVVVKALLIELIKAFDDEIAHGESAAAKLERAASLVKNKEYKTYLTLNAQSMRLQIKASKERREAFQIMRYNYGGTDEVRGRRVRAEFREKHLNFKRLLEEAKKLSHQADDLARQLPDKIGMPHVGSAP